MTRTVYERIPITDEEGNIIGQEGTGQYLKLWTTEEQQETDAEGAPHYWTTVEDPATRYEPQSLLEITADDPAYIEGLEPVYELVPVPPEPVIPLPPSPEERLAALEYTQRDIKRDVQIVNEKVDSTSTDLQAFMDYTFGV